MKINATSPCLWRSFRIGVSAVVITMSCGIVSGCMPIPQTLRDSTPKEGTFATRVEAAGPVTILRTASFVSGAIAYRPSDTQTNNCTSGSISIALTTPRPAPNNIDVQDQCELVMESVLFVSKATGLPTRTLNYDVQLIPEARSFFVKGSSLSLGGPLRVAYTLPLLADTRLSNVNLVSVIAHETAHILAGINRLPMRVRIDESAAYLVGACAQLSVLGSIYQQDLPTVYFVDGAEGIPARGIKSSQEGARVTASLSTFFLDGQVNRESEQGAALKAHCTAVIADQFKVP